MNKSYLNSVKNTALSSKPSTTIRLLLMVLFVFCGKSIGQTTSGTTYIWSTTTSWTPTGVPISSGNVTVNHPLTLDQNLTIGTGNYTFNQDVTDQPGLPNYNLTNSNAAGSLTIASGTTTIGGITDIGGNSTFTLTVKNGATLVLGSPGSTSNNFLIGNNTNITIEQGATLIVYGNIVNSNSSGTFKVNGLLQVYGDYITDNGNIDISGTTGQFYTTGAMTTQGNSSQIYGSSNNCASNCSGTSLGCGTSNPDTAYTATIAPQSQTVCSGGAITQMTFTTNAPSPTYQWESSLTAGGTYTSIAGQTSSTYTPSSLTVTTWYRVKYTSSASGCGTKYSAPIPVYVSASTYTQSTAGQTTCGGTFGPISVSAFGTGLTYQWYSNDSASNSGGSSVSGATSNIYTPSSAVNGTKYYYCVINSSCGIPFTTAVSGAFVVNSNGVTAASSSPVPCINTIMTSITHTTTGATGIGSATGLPSGVSALWASNTITISGTPTQSGTFNYSIPLTGGCGTAIATGTITVTPTLSSVSLSATGSTDVCLSDVATVLNIVETSGATIASRQWGTRSVSGGTITPIGGATASAFTAGTGLTAGSWIVVCTSTSACGVSVVSNEITVTINASPANPGPIAGSTTQCAGNTSQVYSVAPVAGATSYNWFIPSDWTITSGAGTNSITVTVGSAFGNVSVNAINSCGTGHGPSVYVFVSQPTVAGTVTPADTNVCSSSNSTNLSLSGNTGNIVRWESSLDNFAGGTITTIANTGSPITISGVTVDTYYRAVVQSGGCNVLNSNSVKITVTPAMPAPGGVSVNGSTPYPPTGQGISHCANTSTVFSIVPVANASSYTWVIPTGWTVVSGQGTTTLTAITGTIGQSANIEVYASNTGCGNTNSSYLYLYLNPSSAPVVDETQPTCAVPTGTITVTSPAPASGISYTLVGINPVVGAVTNTTGVFPELEAGDYEVTVNNAIYVSAFPKVVSPVTSCTTTKTTVTINALVTTTYNGTSWSSTPDINKIGIISGSGTISANADLCSCTVNTGVNAVVASGVTLKVQDKLTVDGALTFNNTASLVQINNVPNSGNINYVRTTNTAVLSTDYTYWSSPVSPQTIGAFSPKTKEGMMFSYDSSIDDWKQEYLSTSMVAGFGYIVRGPEPLVLPPPPSSYTVNFVGVPNNGDYSIPAIADRSYLLGNPYPSALDADQFLAANAGVLNGTLYFWTHNTQIGTNVSNPGSGVYAYSSDDYATYNATGGVGAAPPDIDPVTGLPVTTGPAPSNPGGTIPSGKIGAGQGFFASTKTSTLGTEIVYTNNMRVGVGGITGDNTQFFKTRNPKEKVVSPIKKNRVWLNLTNTQGAFKQTLVGYITDATNGYDSRFDGESFDGNEFVDFYSINGDKNLTIQGRALPFDENDEVPLGFRTTIAGEFSINIHQTDGVLTNQTVFLEDKLTHTVFDLKSGDYTFNTNAGTFDDRFVLRYKDNTSSKTLGLDETEANDGIIVLYSNNYKTLIIRNNGDSTINSASLFNMAGQNISVWDVKDREQTSIQIPIKDISSGIYVVKVKTTLGESSKKIVIR